MRNPHFFQKCCHFCWLCFNFSKNDNTFERNEDFATVFLKWKDVIDILSRQFNDFFFPILLWKYFSVKCHHVILVLFIRFDQKTNCTVDNLMNFYQLFFWNLFLSNGIMITWTIHSSTERSEQFLVTDFFFNLLLEVSQNSDLIN